MTDSYYLECQETVDRLSYFTEVLEEKLEHDLEMFKINFEGKIKKYSFSGSVIDTFELQIENNSLSKMSNNITQYKKECPTFLEEVKHIVKKISNLLLKTIAIDGSQLDRNDTENIFHTQNIRLKSNYYFKYLTNPISYIIVKFMQDILRHTNGLAALIEMAEKVLIYDNKKYHLQSIIDKTVSKIFTVLTQACKDNKENKQWIYVYKIDFIFGILEKNKYHFKIGIF